MDLCLNLLNRKELRFEFTSAILKKIIVLKRKINLKIICDPIIMSERSVHILTVISRLDDIQTAQKPLKLK